MGNFPFEDFVKSHLNDFAYLAMNVETPYWTTMWRVYEYDDFEQYMANEENAQNYSVLLDEIIEIANTLHPKEDMNSIKLSTPQDHAMYFNEKYVSEQFFDGNYPGFDLQMVIEYIFMNQSTWYNITPQMFENEVNSFEGFISTPAFITFEQEFMKVYSQKMYKVESNTVELNHSNIKDVKLFESDNYFTALLLKNDGTVYSIGSRPGLGGSEFNFDYADRFTKIEGIDNVKDIYMPDKNTIYFVTTDGDVYSYGDNSYKLGHGSAPGEYYKFSPTKITALSNIDKIYSGTTFSFFVSKSGSVFVSGNFGQSRSGHSTNYSINISNLELSMSKPVAAIYPLTNDSGVWNGYRFNSLIEYTDGTTELLIKNPNYYSYEPIAQAFIKESIDVSNISNVTTSKYNGLSILETKNGSLSAMGWNESSIFKNNNLDFYTSTFIPVDTASLKKIEVNQFDSVFLLTNDGHLKYTGRDLFPELTLPGTVLQSGQIYTNGLTKIISVKVKDFSVFGGKHPYDSQNLIIIDENNIIHNYGYITYNSGGD